MSEYIRIMRPKDVRFAMPFKVNPTSCDNYTHYEDYIKFCAITDQKIGLGTTHIYVVEDEQGNVHDILGYITLRSNSLIKIIGIESGEYEEGHSALEISELAVKEGFERNDIGSKLVEYALVMATELNDSKIGIEYITLCADPRSVDFYKKLEFDLMSNHGELLPREGWNRTCIPMYLKIHVG